MAYNHNFMAYLNIFVLTAKVINQTSHFALYFVKIYYYLL